MNERIRELAEQADNFADDKIQMPGEYHPDWHDVRDEKFAELIVAECMDCATWVGKVNKNAVEPIHTAHAINQRIKRKFEIE